MMLPLRYLGGLGIITLSACVTSPPPFESSANETEAICQMAEDVKWGPFGTVSWEKNPDRIAELDGVIADKEFVDLPARMNCPDGAVSLNGLHGLPFDKFWLSADGTKAAISGGWFGGEMLGGGGICYFSKREDKWIRQGCTATWAI